MSHRVRGILERLLGRRIDAAVSDVVTDAELLQRFTATRDEAAFELLVWRHGAMVLGLCRRAVRDEQLAEDAFQAVFLVLARKAGLIRGGNVGGWLFGVARRVAARAARRRPVTHAVPEVPVNAPSPAVEHQELAAILDAEVARLPERFRSVVVLCYLGGHTTEAAARELGCPRGTILSRLAAARKRLADRLTRRGVTLPAIGLFVAELTTTRLVSQTVCLAQNPFPEPVATGPALLAESVVRSMTTTKLVMACGGVLLVAGLTLGVGWAGSGAEIEAAVTGVSPALQPEPGQPKKAAEPKEAAPTDRDAKVDRLRKQSAEIRDRIQELRRVHERMAPEADGIDVTVLQAELYELDKRILTEEDRSKTCARQLQTATKNHEASAKRPIPEGLVDQFVTHMPEVQVAVANLQKKSRVVDNLTGQVATESPTLAAAKKEVVTAANAVDEARAKARPAAEKAAREQELDPVATRLEAAREALESAEIQLKQLLGESKATRRADCRREEGRGNSASGAGRTPSSPRTAGGSAAPTDHCGAWSRRRATEQPPTGERAQTRIAN